MSEEKIIEYLELLNDFQLSGQRKEVKRFTAEESELIAEGNKFLQTDSEFQRLVKLSLPERQKYVEEYKKNRVEADKPQDILDITDYEQLDQNIQLQTVTYSEQPNLLEDMDETEKTKWNHCIKLYREYKNKQYVKPEMPKQKILTQHENGSVNVIILSFLLIITMLAIFLVSSQIYK